MRIAKCPHGDNSKGELVERAVKCITPVTRLGMAPRVTKAGRLNKAGAFSSTKLMPKTVMTFPMPEG